MMVMGDRLDIPVYAFNTENSTLTARLSIVDYADQFLTAILAQDNE